MRQKPTSTPSIAATTMGAEGGLAAPVGVDDGPIVFTEDDEDLFKYLSQVKKELLHKKITRISFSLVARNLIPSR